MGGEKLVVERAGGRGSGQGPNAGGEDSGHGSDGQYNDCHHDNGTGYGSHEPGQKLFGEFFATAS